MPLEFVGDAVDWKFVCHVWDMAYRENHPVVLRGGVGPGAVIEGAVLLEEAEAVQAAALAQRTEALAAMDSFAASRRAAGGLATAEDVTLYGSGTYDLSGAQLRSMGMGEMGTEMGVKMGAELGLHMEEKLVLTAFEEGLTPQVLYSKWVFCPECRLFLQSVDGIIVNDHVAVWRLLRW